MYHHFSTASDVYAFGVLMYEVLTYGCTPYRDVLKDDEVSNRVIERREIVQKEDCFEDFEYLLIKQCCKWQHNQRLNFHDIRDQLGDIINKQSDQRKARRDPPPLEMEIFGEKVCKDISDIFKTLTISSAGNSDDQEYDLVGLHTDFVQAKDQGKMEDSDEMIGMERASSLSSEEVAHYQGTGMIGTATDSDDEEVLIATFGEKVDDDIPGRKKNKRWTREENAVVMECYYKSRLSRDLGYMKRMHDLWIDKGMVVLTKEELAAQARSILNRKSNEDKLKVIRDRVGFQEEEGRQDRCVIC